MQTYQSTAIADLARQLLRGPRRLRLRQLLNIEFLLSVVTPDKFYPIDFVCHTLTGYRRPNRQNDRPSETISGEVLTSDLVRLAEVLSEDARLAVEGWPAPVYSINELAERFNVSTKTVFRWRRRGLVGWKFRYPDRRVRLAFPDSAVRRFVSRNADIVERGRSFSQLTQEERTRIISRARVLYEQGETTINAVARALSSEISRAPETIRLILKAYDEAHPRAGIFNRSKLEVPGDDLRLQVWEAHQDGAGVEALAARFNRPVDWIYRTLTQMRARSLKATAIEFVPSDEFDQPDAEERILSDPAVRNPYQENGTGRRRAPADLPPYLQQLFNLPLLSPEGEAALFRKMNFLKYQAHRLREAIDPETVTPAELDRIEALLDEANRVKNQIIQANLRLVVSIAKRHIGPGLDFFEIVSDGNMSLMRAVERFDYTRGFKFSTYASWAIIRNYARLIPERRRRQERYQTGRDELLENVPEPFYEEQDDEQVRLVRRTLDRMLSTLEDREQNILRQRFGLDEYHQPQTLEQVGRRFGVSKERIRQIEARAISKLREAFDPEIARRLGV